MSPSSKSTRLSKAKDAINAFHRFILMASILQGQWRSAIHPKSNETQLASRVCRMTSPRASLTKLHLGRRWTCWKHPNDSNLKLVGLGQLMYPWLCSEGSLWVTFCRANLHGVSLHVCCQRCVDTTELPESSGDPVQCWWNQEKNPMSCFWSWYLPKQFRPKQHLKFERLREILG